MHVHHMVIGVVLMVVTGLVLIAFSPDGLWLQLCALVFGAGVALTLDEFALILRLQDVYWTAEGRLSVDAVIVAVCAGLLFVLGLQPCRRRAAAGLAGSRRRGRRRRRSSINLCFAVVCLLEGQATGRASSASSCRSSGSSGPSAWRDPPRRGLTGAMERSRRSWPRRSAARTTSTRPGAPGARRSSTSSPASRTCRA